MNLNCSFCKKTYTEPKFLPCSHGFCKACLNFQITKVPTNMQWEGFSCPFCKKYTKAIDPDEPLHLWAEQFPGKPSIPRKASEPSVHIAIRAVDLPDGRTSSAEVGLSRTESPVRTSPTSDLRHASTPPPSVSSEGQGTVPPRPSTSLSVSSEPMSPLSKTGSSLSSGTSSVSDKGLSKLFSVSESVDSQDGEDVFTVPEAMDNMTIADNEPDTSVEDSTGTEEQMCMMHPWKPVIIKCTRCDTVACGQCLVENHLECSGEDFLPFNGNSLMPDVAELEEEVQKVNSVNELITSSSERLQNTRKALHEKIKQMTRQMIRDIRNEEQQMVRKIQHLYRKETIRLKSGIAPSSVLMNEVKLLKKNTEELTTHHFTDLLQSSDGLMARQKSLLIGLKSVDVMCIPPDVDFVRKWDAIDINLGDIVVDHGLYPKHDIIDTQPHVTDTPEPQDVPQIVPEEKVNNNSTEAQHQIKPSTLKSLRANIPKARPLPPPPPYKAKQGGVTPDIVSQLGSQAAVPTPDKGLPTTTRTMTPAASSNPAQAASVVVAAAATAATTAAVAAIAASPNTPGHKSKSHTLMSRLFSPKQSQKPDKPNPKPEKSKSKFYVKKS